MNRHIFSLAIALVAAVTTLSCADEPELPEAPDFVDGLQWLNVNRPLSMEDLRGRVVILDFWTYGCINCIHVMEELKRLQARYGERLVVVGVHSPKFEHEQELDSLRAILKRYERHEPVVNDPAKIMMYLYSVPAWPTLALIDPRGRYVGRVLGEGNEARLASAIDLLLEIHAAEMINEPLALLQASRVVSDGWFGAPEKIAAVGNRVAVSDSLFNRLTITDATGKVLWVVGGKEAGFRDGSLTEARFTAPRGLVFADEQTLYLADTGNHALRLVDLAKGEVSTIAGTGRKAENLRVPSGRAPTAMLLRSPWALALHGRDLFVAMAGDHRIWRFDLERNLLAPYAGTGGEGIDDGRVADATFSQPSGLALLGDALYVADAEASAIRRIDLREGEVRTLVGTGLHDFGDRSGALADALLQHAQGIAVATDGAGRSLLVADTYNHRIKVLDLEAGRVRSLLGTGEAGAALSGDSVALNEPGGLAVQGERVLIADTHNRRVLSFDPEQGEVRLWEPDSAVLNDNQGAVD